MFYYRTLKNFGTRIFLLYVPEPGLFSLSIPERRMAESRVRLRVEAAIVDLADRTGEEKVRGEEEEEEERTDRRQTEGRLER